MNTIPSELIAIPNFHGYFWHPKEQVVYSMKVDGILKPLKSVSEWRVGYIHLPAGVQSIPRRQEIQDVLWTSAEPYEARL